MRVWIFLLLPATLAVAEERVRLVAGKPKYAVDFGYALPEAVAAKRPFAARRGKLQRSNFFFFDVDGNGKFNDLGVDGWALAKMPMLLPLEEETVIGLSRYRWRVEENGSAVHFTKERLPLSPRQEKVLVQFNTWRLMNGLPAVSIDEKLSAACGLHCGYMERHGFEHGEDEEREGYTPEGAEAGLRSCLSQEKPGMSVLMFYSSFYHRLPLIHPGTTAIGIGSSPRYTAVDGLTTKRPRAWRYPILVPAPNSFQQPTHFSRELPRPHPEGMKPGFPITLTFDGGTITDAKAELRAIGRRKKRGPPLPILLSSPEAPANPRRAGNRRTICILPRSPLPPNVRFQVSVSWKRDGAADEREWVFSTGRPRPIPVYR